MDGTTDETLKLLYSQGLSAGVFRRTARGDCPSRTRMADGLGFPDGGM